MKLPLQITFRHFPHSSAVEAAIREEAAELDRFYSRIMSCRVALDRFHHKHQKNIVYHVRIDLTVPSHELVVGHDLRQGPGHQDVYMAIRHAFHAARRQLEDYAQRLREAS